jgi:rod shape determining protein RodA
MLHFFDWGLLALVFSIPLVGLVVLYSAGYDPDVSSLMIDWLSIEVNSTAFLKQINFLGIGLIVLLIGVSIPPTTFSRYSYFFYVVCIGLLASVLLFGIVVNGSRRWLNFGAINLQPAEPMKLALILALARYLSRHPPERGGYKFTQLFWPVVLIVLPMGLILVQPDLGTALSIAAVGGAMVLFTGVRPRALLYLAGGAVASLVPAWGMLHDYQRRRVLTLFNPESDPLGSGWHVTQSKIAIGSGELFGKGFLQGSQAQLEFLPERTTDFIFSVLAEEWGFLGAMLVLFLYCMLLLRILRVSVKSRDLFSSLVVFGIGFQLFFHVFVNIGMIIGILPVVGIPLPLFSYGGSSVLSVLFGIGIILGASMRRTVFAGR